MRHFSGEFEGIRLLMGDELEQIAGGEGEDTDDLIPFDECQDRRSDGLAQALGNRIANAPDTANIEYGAVIFRNADGTLGQTRMLIGNSSGVPDFNSSPQSLGFSSWTQVVGILHSHPTVHSSGAQITPDWNHDKPSGNDWQYMDWIASQSGVDTNNLRQYIYHAGQMNEYYYNDNNQTQWSPDNRWKFSVKSDSYQPNATCPEN
ncbi:hypothetical protein [Niveispirillum irakense]|uniref:hypothetical protein n=1 Tax=Niveispirillum irakense TaxID=34011 RepID=UPI0012B669BB|nr:hypothetical protein [Niveispirillum irakense]